MDDDMWLVVQALAHTVSRAAASSTLTWWIIRGLLVSIHSEGEKHHD